MPIKTSKRNASSVQLYASQQASSEERVSEYDTEFGPKLGLSVASSLPAMRWKPATPRSYKRGFVHCLEYEKLVRRPIIAERTTSLGCL